MPDFLIQTRDQKYEIKIKLYDPSGQEYNAESFAVEALCLEESLQEWQVKGFIVFAMRYEVLEKSKIYTIRHDSRNRVNLQIKPLGGEWDPTYGHMNFDCVIYDIEDIPHTDPLNKLRKFYIIDERYQFFKERNIEWSTAWWSKDERKKKNSSRKEWTHFSPDVKDYKKSMRANRALKALILSAGSKYFDPNAPDIFIGGTLLGKIGSWDDGGYSNRIFYTSPSNFSVLDDIRYVSNNISSKSGSPVFLRYGRTTESKSWSLISLHDILKTANDNQIERIQLLDTISRDGLPYIPRAPENSFASPIASVINTYKLAHMSAMDADRITNKALHHYNFATNQYNIYQDENSAAATLLKAHEYAEELYGYKKSKQLLINLNKAKTAGYMQQHILSPMNFIQTTKLQQDMIHDIFLLNQGLFFQTAGLTLRQPGKFVFVDKNDSHDNNPFDDKFLGPWLITKVTHMFTRTTYSNDVLLVKADSFSRVWRETDEKE